MCNDQLDFAIDIYGQQSATAFATPFLFLFPCTDASVAIATSIQDKLETGLNILCHQFPYLAGRVTLNARGDYVIRAAQRPAVVLRNRCNDAQAPSLDELVASRWCQAKMSESLFSPVFVLGGKNPEPEDRNAVLTVQLTVLRGGVAVNVVGHHQVMDGTGQERVTTLLQKACRGEPFTEEEIRLGLMDRSTSVTLLGDTWQPSADTPFLRKPSSPSAAFASPSAWVNISFSSRSLVQVKAEASKDLDPGCAYVSTDDALVALIWSSLARARSQRLPSSETATSTMARSVDPRRYVGLSRDYPGYLHNMALTTETLASLSTTSLGSIASHLRRAIDPASCTLGQTTRELGTLIHRAENRNEPGPASGLDLDIDIMFSSWANMRCYDFDFGLGLGKPAFFGRPRMTAKVPSLMFLMPKRAGDASCTLTACLNEKDIDALRQDKIFSLYAEYVG
ncbi:transferase [Filobasidium floriforme]|uniref:transferase n=1 Tax=Filobasidium floriforme TaxID=5210 RepID=UPI001E8DE5CA|nr:transferase [Filobasidium floriforme]KAH8088620.1 transferase [Filobasidium floriforme]